MYEAWLEAVKSGVTVVTANNRLARTLRGNFDQQQLHAGQVTWPSPDFVAWPHWLQRLWEESRLRGGQGGDLRLLDDTTAALIWQQSVMVAEQERQNIPLAQFGRAAAATWKLLLEWQAQSADEWTDAGLTSDQRAFLRWLGEFRQRAATGGWVTRDELPALLSLDIAAGLFDDLAPVCFAGFDEWSPARTSIRAALQARELEFPLQVAPAVSGHCQGYACRTQADEILAAAHWARELIDAEPEARVAVVVPDLATRALEVRRGFADVFVPGWRVSGLPAATPLNVSYGQPLASTPLVHAALLLFRLSAGRATFNELSLLLRSPWLQGATAEAAERAIAEIQLRSAVLAEFSLQEALPVCRKLAPEFSTVLTALIDRSGYQARQSAAQWAHWLTEMLQSVGWPGSGPLASESWQALQAWNELLGAFAAASAELGEINRNAALAALSHLAQQRIFQPEGSADGVQVMGVLEAAGHQFDYLWLCGMARELWPIAGRPDPFVPLRLQRRLGMPDCSAERVLEHASVVTRRLLASAPQVVCSWPESLDDEALSPSPLVGELNMLAAGRFRQPLWNEQALAAGGTDVLLDDPAPPWVAEQRVRGGASVLNLQAVSPINAFVEKRLGAFELIAPPVGINAMQRGNVTHATLEHFYRKVPDQAALQKMSESERHELLDNLLRAALAQLPGMRDEFMQYLAALERERQLQRIDAFLQLDMQRPPFHIVGLETKHDVKVGPIKLQLKLDRLDQVADEHSLVIDYKTGRINRQSWNPAKPRDLQLPLYVTTVASEAVAVAFGQISVFGIAYDGVGDSDTGIAGIRSPGRKPRLQVRYQYPEGDPIIESWAELKAEWATLLGALAEQFAAGDFRLDPRNPASGRGQFAPLSRIYDAGLLFEVEE